MILICADNKMLCYSGLGRHGIQEYKMYGETDASPYFIVTKIAKNDESLQLYYKKVSKKTYYKVNVTP